MMNNEPSPQPENDMMGRLKSMVPGDAWPVLEEAFTPLKPLAAQLLWFAQPVFGLFGADQSVGELAERLAEPPLSEGME